MLKWIGAVRDYETCYHDGDRVNVPVPTAGYENWFRMTLTEIDAGKGPRQKWSWALTDEAMRELERLAPEIKNWLEEAA
jgi:hypothetical protein